MAMPPIPLPVSKLWVRASMSAFGILLMALSYGSFSGGQPLDALILLCGGGIVLLSASVYLSDWYLDIENGMRIIVATFFAALLAGFVTFAVYGPKESIVGALMVGFVGEIAGAFCAVYLHHRDKAKIDEDISK